MLGRKAAPAASSTPPPAAATSRAERRTLRPWKVLAASALVAAFCLIGGDWVAGRALGALWPSGEPPPAMPDLAYSLLIFGPLLIAAVVGARLSGSAGMRLGRPLVPLVGLGVAIGAGGLLLAAGLAGLAQAAAAGAAPDAGLRLIALGTILAVFQAGTEEIFLRGWLQPILAEHWRGWAAVLVTALLFAVLHLLGGERTPLSLLNLMLGGVLFGLLALKSGGLAAPIAAHFTWNWSESVLLGLDPNPGVGSFGSIVNLDLTGPAVWGGSGEGLNASLAMTLTLCALIGPLALSKRRSPQQFQFGTDMADT